MSTKATTAESSTESRTIERERYRRACSERMSVRFAGPGIADVTHGEQAYRIELESGACECRDYEFRGHRLICKHALRVCLAALYAPDQRDTELVARVARFTRNQGCVHGVRGCCGPTTTSARLGGLPCQQCIDVVRSANTDEYTVWQRLVGSGRR